MSDCVDLDYSYTFKDGVIYCNGISLKDDFDIDNPMQSLERYAGVRWQDLAMSAIIDGYFSPSDE